MTDVMIVIQATFADASTVISIAESSDIPIVVWSFPEDRRGARLRLNSLCGANLAAYSLRRRQHRCAFVHTSPTATDAGDRVRTAIDEARRAPRPRQRRAWRRRRCSTRTSCGQRSESTSGCTATASASSAPRRPASNRAEATTNRSPRRSASRSFDSNSTTSSEKRPQRAAPASTMWSIACPRHCRSTPRLSSDDLEPSARLYCGMRRFVDHDDLSAVATRCWPECMADFGGAACTPHAMLTEDRIPGVCEADVLGAVTALVLQRVAGTDPFIADLVDVDESDDTSVLWHCGVALDRGSPLRTTSPSARCIRIDVSRSSTSSRSDPDVSPWHESPSARAGCTSCSPVARCSTDHVRTTGPAGRSAGI